MPMIIACQLAYELSFESLINPTGQIVITRGKCDQCKRKLGGARAFISPFKSRRTVIAKVEPHREAAVRMIWILDRDDRISIAIPPANEAVTRPNI